MLRHVVVWSVEAGRESEVDELLEDLRAMTSQIDEIEALSCGRLVNDSPYQGALTVDMADEEALDRYRKHPAHVTAAQKLRAQAKDLVIADYLF